MNGKVPQWALTMIEEARLFYGLDDAWLIEVEMVDRPNGSDSTAGCCTADSSYLNAKIDLLKTLEPNNGLSHRTIYHEVGHVATAEIEDVLQAILSAHVSNNKERIAWVMIINQVVERFLQRLVRAHYPLEQANGEGING